jgi:FtsH-binding integral membrane protein
MPCDKCKRVTQGGDYFYFFYGKKGETTLTSKDALSKEYTTPYYIAGGKKAYICPRCEAIGFVNSTPGVVTIGAAIFFLYILFREMGTLDWENAGIIALVYVIVVGGYWLTFRGNWGAYALKTFGDLAAISAYRKELKKEGHDAFLTRAQAIRIGERIPDDVCLKVKDIKAEPIYLEEELCWYCGSRASLEEAAVVYTLKKEDKEKKVEVPRCEFCVKTHDKIAFRSLLLAVLMFLLTAAVCLVSGLVNDNWWMGVGLSFAMLFVIGIIFSTLLPRMHKSAGVRNQEVAVNQFPGIVALKEAGWKHTQTQAKIQERG